VWTEGGCDSWYLDESGRNAVLWPRSVGAFRRRVAEFDPADYLALEETSHPEHSNTVNAGAHAA